MLTEILDTRKDDIQQVRNKDEVRMLQFILSQSIPVGSVSYPLIQLALNNKPILGSGQTGKQLASQHGVKRVGEDWCFSEEIIQSKEWWKRSEFVGNGIKEALFRL